MGGHSIDTMSYKVAVCGGSGGIGQPLSMLIAQNPRVKALSVIDVNMAACPAAGVAADLSHLTDLDCEVACQVSGYAIDVKVPAKDQLQEALTGCDIVMIPAGIPRKPGMTRDDLFNINCGIAKGLVEACAEFCPNAVLGMIVNPVNSVVPAMAHLYESKGLDPLKVVGVTMLDVVRAKKFLTDSGHFSSEYLAAIGGANVAATPAEGSSKACSGVLVIGGHAGKTILPVLGDALKSAGSEMACDALECLDVRIQNAGTEVVEAKAGAGSATLSMATAGAMFVRRVVSGLDGADNASAVCCSYVKSSLMEGLDFFASPVKFGPGGSVSVLPFSTDILSETEKKRLTEDVVPQLQQEIEKGMEFAKKE